MADSVAIDRAAAKRRGRAGSSWQSAVILEIVPRTPRIVSVFLAPARPFAFVPGQHLSVAVRRGLPDRKYSIASAPESGAIVELAIEALAGGEVSGYFHRTAAPGDTVEIRGPKGDFTWTVADGGPILLIGGGSGLVPLMSMIRHRALRRSPVRVGLVYSATTWDDVLFRDELLELAAAKDGFELVLTLTRERQPRADTAVRRIDRAMIADMLARLPGARGVFICGSDPFVDNARAIVSQLGVAAKQIRIESYGV
jgi:ferredoxin-NADP reductase